MSLRVYGVVLHDGQGPPKLLSGLSLVTVRELAAVTENGEYNPRDMANADVERHLEVVGALFNQDPVLPTPVGTVFKSAEVLQRWMELHYVALSDALAWVEDRIGARVHVNRKDGRLSDREAGSDLAAIAADVTRSLRRRAVASVPLRSEEVTGIGLSSAYLIERGLWQDFVDAVQDEREKRGNVSIELTGPWPPYDFVRLQFGS